MLRHLGVTKKRQKRCKSIASAILLSKFKEFYVNLKKLRSISFLLRTKRKIRNTEIGILCRFILTLCLFLNLTPCGASMLCILGALHCARLYRAPRSNLHSLACASTDSLRLIICAVARLACFGADSANPFFSAQKERYGIPKLVFSADLF